MLRYLVERISDGVFLELELPILVDSSSTAFNGPGHFSGEVLAVADAYRFAGSDELIDPWATYIHEEADGVIRGSWLVTRSSYEGYAWKIEGQGFSSFFNGCPYTGEFRGVQVSPVGVARHVIMHAQSQAGGDIGVTVRGTSDMLVGSDSDQKVGEALTASKAAKRAVDDAKADLKAKRAAAKANPTPANKAAVTAAEAVVKSAETAKEKADETLEKAKERQSEDGGAWKILWWDTPDVLDEFQNAVDAAGMEWFERSYWNTDRTGIVKELVIVDRVGRVQDNLSFIEGDNVIEAVVVESDGSKYANAVVAIGAGEGRDALRVSLAASDSRRRRVAVIDAKEVTKKATLERLARAELDQRMRRYRASGVRVVDHPNAEFGTFGPGDTITVECDVPWIGRQSLRHRVAEVERVSEDIVDLMLGDA